MEDQFKFWELLVNIAIIFAWLIGTGYLFEYTVNREADTGLFALAIVVEVIFTYLLIKLFKPINL